MIYKKGLIENNISDWQIDIYDHRYNNIFREDSLHVRLCFEMYQNITFFKFVYQNNMFECENVQYITQKLFFFGQTLTN